MYRTIQKPLSHSCLIAAMLLLTGAAPGILTASPQGSPIAPEKQRVLDEYLAMKEQREALHAGQPLDLNNDDTDTPEQDVSESEKQQPRQQSSSGLAFWGTDGFALLVDISTRPSQSFLGYVVDAPDDAYQDMVILIDLTKLDTGECFIDAACTDVHKQFPPSNYRMTSSPWTSASSSHWAYWVRKAVTAGVQNGYQFDEIQLAVWYITDRAGEYNSLLHGIGYDVNGPTKNAAMSPVNDWSQVELPPVSVCGAGLCGAGFLPVIPLTLLGIAAMKTWTVRRAGFMPTGRVRK